MKNNFLKKFFKFLNKHHKLKLAIAHYYWQEIIMNVHCLTTFPTTTQQYLPFHLYFAFYLFQNIFHFFLQTSIILTIPKECESSYIHNEHFDIMHIRKYGLAHCYNQVSFFMCKWRIFNILNDHLWHQTLSVTQIMEH